jgi:hypothetical protein
MNGNIDGFFWMNEGHLKGVVIGGGVEDVGDKGWRGR